MSEMIERVARAMLASDYPDDVGGELEYLWWDRHGETYLRYARAAVESMREPTEAMARAALFSDPFVPMDGLLEIEKWKIMIDEAIK